MALQGIRRISPGIVQDPSINSGRPIIEGTRVFVDRLIGHLESGMSNAEICYEYDLTPEQVQAVKQLTQPGTGSVCEGLCRCAGKCRDEVREA